MPVQSRIGWRDVLVGIGLCGLVAIAFGRAARYAFFSWDDGVYVLENPLVRAGVTSRGVIWAFTHRHGTNWHPLTTLSHMLDCQLFGVNPHAFHLVNICLHAAAVVLLFALLRSLGVATWPSALISALFGIHPLRVESVVWISERKDVLSGLFFMLTLLAYVAYTRRRSALRYAVVALLFICGLMAKPMLVTVPFVLLLLDWWPLRRMGPVGDLKQKLIEKIPLFAISAAGSAVTVWAQRNAIASNEHIGLLWRLNQAVVSYAVYVGQLFWPANLSVLYPHMQGRFQLVETAVAAIFLTVVTITAIRCRRSFPYLLTGWLWFAGMLVPVIGLVQVGSQAHADRYTYLPHIGLCLAAVLLLQELVRRWRLPTVAVAGAGALIVTILTAATVRQTGYWQSSETLWRHALELSPDNFLAHASIAGISTKQGKADDAIAEAQQALAIQPGDPMALNELGLAFFMKGNPNDAVAAWRQALQAQPNNLNAASNVAWVLATCPNASVRNGPRAVELTENVISRAGYSTGILQRTLGAAYAESGRFEEAAAAAEKGIQLAREANNEGLVRELEHNIDDYKRGVPLRDPSLANVED